MCQFYFLWFKIEELIDVKGGVETSNMKSLEVISEI